MNLYWRGNADIVVSLIFFHTILCEDGKLRGYLYKVKNSTEPIVLVIFNPKAHATACFWLGKTRGCTGWQICWVLDNLTKARAFSSITTQSLCFKRPRVYPRLLQKRILNDVTAGGMVRLGRGLSALHTEFFQNRGGTRNCMAFSQWSLGWNKFLYKMSLKEHGHSFILLLEILKYLNY